MKKSILLLIIVSCIMFLTAGKAGSQEHTVRATKYYAGHGCGWVTADGSRINNQRVETFQDRWVALSPDMFKKGYKLGDRIMVTSDNSLLHGVWIVKDKMAPRITNGIDFLMTRTNSKKFENPCKVKIRKI